MIFAPNKLLVLAIIGPAALLLVIPLVPVLHKLFTKESLIFAAIAFPVPVPPVPNPLPASVPALLLPPQMLFDLSLNALNEFRGELVDVGPQMLLLLFSERAEFSGKIWFNNRLLCDGVVAEVVAVFVPAVPIAPVVPAALIVDAGSILPLLNDEVTLRLPISPLKLALLALIGFVND